MNIKIITDEKNPLFKRREVTAKLGYNDKTPSRLEIRKEIAKKLGAREEMVVVERIKPDFGTPAAALEFKVYDDDKIMKEIEAEYMINRHSPKGKKGEAGEQTPAEEKKEEPKKEDKKEEKPEGKAEEKKEEAKPEKKEEAKKEAKEDKEEDKK